MVSYQRLMRFLAIPFIFVLTPLNGMAGTPEYEPPPGTYKTIDASSIDECRQSCFGEKGCKGVFTLQPDTTIETYVCYLNDGLAAGSPFEILPPEPLDLQIAVTDLNLYRAKHNLGVVTLDDQLVLASEIHAQDMADNNVVSHTGTDGSAHTDRMLRTGYKYSSAGENVASGQNSWNKVFKAWQKSPGHNENLLMPEATNFGVALVYDRTAQYHYYWAMIMASPMDQALIDAGLVSYD